MVLRRITKKIQEENWPSLTLELLVVIVGILLAFQVERAYEGWQDRELEQRYLLRLKDDLSEDTAAVSEVIARTQRRLSQLALLERLIVDPELAGDDPDAFAYALEQVTWRSVPTITTYAYEELLSTGRMALLRSEGLRSGLAEYYSLLDDQRRLGLDEDDQAHFRLETLGLLSGAHLSAIEDSARYPLDLDSTSAIRIAEAFASRTTAHPWLSRLVKYQVLMRRISADFGERANVLLRDIDAQLAGRN